MPQRPYLLHQHLHRQQRVSSHSSLLPFRVMTPTQQSLRSLDRHSSPPLLLLHRLRPPLHLPPRHRLFQSLIRRASQSSFWARLPSPYRLLPLRRLTSHRDPPHYLPKPPVRVSRTRPPSRQMLCARAKMVTLLPICPSFRVPWQTAKTVGLASVASCKLVLAVPALVPPPQVCLVRE
jgi:hypothetical protein